MIPSVSQAGQHLGTGTDSSRLEPSGTFCSAVLCHIAVAAAADVVPSRHGLSLSPGHTGEPYRNG